MLAKLINKKITTNLEHKKEITSLHFVKTRSSKSKHERNAFLKMAARRERYFFSGNQNVLFSKSNNQPKRFKSN